MRDPSFSPRERIEFAFSGMHLEVRLRIGKKPGYDIKVSVQTRLSRRHRNFASNCYARLKYTRRSIDNQREKGILWRGTKEAVPVNVLA